MLNPNFDVSEMFHARESERSAMHTKHLNEQLVRVLKTIGYDVGFRRGQGQYVYDRNDACSAASACSRSAATIRSCATR